MTGDVTPLKLIRSGKEPGLTDLELKALRQMLREFSTIRSRCPIARRAVEETKELGG